MWFRQCRMPKRLRGVAPLALRLTHFCYANFCTSVASPPLGEVGGGFPSSSWRLGGGFPSPLGRSGGASILQI